jgi:hypothetical protein
LRPAAALLALSLLGMSVVAADRPAGEKPPLPFTDVTAESGLEPFLRGALNHGLAWGDIDGDGRLDLFLGNFADRPNQPRDGINGLYRQVERGKFAPFAAPAVERRGRCSGAVFADLDNDGDLDLYVSSNTLPRPGAKEPLRSAQAEPSRLFRNDGGGKFADISQTSAACAELYRTRDIGVFDYDNDGLLDLFLTQDPLLVRDQRVPRCRLFRNLGQLRFEDVTDKVGLPQELSALGVAVGDVNDDRRPDFFTCDSNRLFLSQPNGTYREASALNAVFAHNAQNREDIVSGASFGDIDRDGDLDLITGPHFVGARVHVYLNDGLKEGVPQFREITRAVGIPVIPQKAPHTDIQDFDNDGWPDLYWSAFFAEGPRRWPFICRGLGVRDGLPRFAVPSIERVKPEGLGKNLVPAEGLGMVYYVDGPAVDYDGDGDLDLLAGIWPEECSRFFRNDSPPARWLQVRVEGRKMNRMGIGARVRIYAPGRAGEAAALIGHQEITVNGGYSSGRPAVAHFGLGALESCDVEVLFPSRPEPLRLPRVKSNQLLMVSEPEQ